MRNIFIIIALLIIALYTIGCVADKPYLTENECKSYIAKHLNYDIPEEYEPYQEQYEHGGRSLTREDLSSQHISSLEYLGNGEWGFHAKISVKEQSIFIIENPRPTVFEYTIWDTTYTLNLVGKLYERIVVIEIERIYTTDFKIETKEEKKYLPYLP